MPRLTRLRTAALEDLAAQLRFAPRRALLRDIDRAEALAREIDPDATYPLDWIIFRVTGYRPEDPRGRPGLPTLVAGRDLLADVSALVERLSDAAAIPKPADTGTPDAPWLDVPALRARWGVSAKTIERLRRQGLVARRVVLPDHSGRRLLIFSRAGVERFESLHREALARAASFSRLGPELEERLVRRADRYRRVLGWSLNQAATRLAARFGRSREAVRQVLRRHESRGVRGGKDAPDPRRDRPYRAWRRGAGTASLAATFRVSRSSAVRAVNAARADRLREAIAGLRATGACPHAENPGIPPPPPLTPAIVLGLGEPGRTDALALLREASSRRPPDALAERERTAAYRALVARAGAIVASLGAVPASGTRLDEAETALRWALRIKAELLRDQMPLVVAALREQLRGPPEALRPASLVGCLRACLAAAAEAIDRHDPAHGGRVAGPVGVLTARAAARWAQLHSPEVSRAGTRAVPLHRDSPRLTDWTRRLAPWQRWIEPPPRVRAALARLSPERAALLRERFGWGEPPRTLAEAGRRRGWIESVTAREERAALREALTRPPAAGG